MENHLMWQLYAMRAHEIIEDRQRVARRTDVLRSAEFERGGNRPRFRRNRIVRALRGA